MPFSSTTTRTHRRAQVRRRDNDGPCSLQITTDCQAVGGQINYDARPPHPRSYEVDRFISTDEAQRIGWSSVDADALENLQSSCRQCNRSKSSGMGSTKRIRATYLNPRFA